VKTANPSGTLSSSHPASLGAVSRQNQLVELATQNEETIQIQLNLEDERVLKGSGIAIDVLQAKSRLQ